MLRSTTLLAAMLAPGLAQAICPDKAEATISPRIIAELTQWIEDRTDYDVTALADVTIQFCESDVTYGLSEVGLLADLPLQAAYDPATATIYLTAPWSPIDPEMSSTLLHMMLHHVQLRSDRVWKCLNATEFEAYWLQDQWVVEQGYRTGFDWTQVLVDSHCSAVRP